MTNGEALLHVAARGALTLAAIGVAVRVRRELAASLRGYLGFLLAPWKVVTFGIAFAAFVLGAPYTGDPTWDHVDGGLMAALTFASAPWALGTLFRLLPAPGRPRTGVALAFVAAVAWLVSTSFSYDVYVWTRDGHYPGSWRWNLVVSSVLYACAGGMWSLAWRADRGVHLAFQEPGWDPVAARSWRVAPWALVPMALVVAALLPFVWDHLPRLVRR